MARVRPRFKTILVALVLATLAIVPVVAIAYAPSHPTLTALPGAEPVIAHLEWTASQSAARYAVSVATTPTGPFRVVGETNAQTLSYDFEDGISGVPYYFRVTAINEQGEQSQPTAPACGPVTGTWVTDPHKQADSSSNKCQSCHVPHGALASPLMRTEIATDAPGQVATCMSCHDGKIASVPDVAAGAGDSFGLASGHSLDTSTSAGGLTTSCASCHDPHASAAARSMIPGEEVNGKPVSSAGNTWCFACHDDENSWYPAAYPSSSAPQLDAAGYPIVGTWLGQTGYDGPGNAHRLVPSTTQTGDPGRQVRRGAGDCLYCHAAHRAPNAYDGLLATYRPTSASTLVADKAQGDYAALCFTCHGGAVPSGFATAPVDIKQFVTSGGDTAGHTIVSAGGLLPVGSPLPCYECHNPHGSSTGNVSMISDARGASMSTTGGPEAVRRFCFTCHTTADSTNGWDSDSGDYVAVAPGAKVVGIARSGGVLHLPATVVGHSENDSASCYACHGSDYAPEGNNVHSPSMGGYDGQVHASAVPPGTVQINGTSYGPFSCSQCHSTELGPEHAKSSSSTSASGCSACHPNPRNTLSPWSRIACAEGGCHTSGSSAPQHAGLDAAHTPLPESAACSAAGCHVVEDLASVHADATGTVAGQERSSCMLCHATGVPVSKDCAVCHADKTTSHYDEAVHTATQSSGTMAILGTDFGSHECSECHESAGLGAIHTAGCVTCHPTPAASAKPWNKSCATADCHTATSTRPQHGTIDAAHTIGAQTCTAQGCHAGAGNVAAVHVLEGCATCHGTGVTPTLACTTSGCHADMNGHGDVTAIHASTISADWITFFDGSADHANWESGEIDTYAQCTMCHASTNLVSIHASDCAICHLGSSPPRSSFTTWNKGCSQASCHATYHDNASPGHDGEYDGGNGDCDACHNYVGWGGWDGNASADFCGNCHALGADTTAPSSYSDMVPSYVGTASVGVWGSDDRSLKATYYRLDGGATSTVNGPVLVAPPSAGTQSHTLEYWSTDWSSNAELPHETGIFSVTVDVAAPVTTSDASAAYGGSATIHLTATDDATDFGVRATYYRFDEQPYTVGTTAVMPQPASGTETHTVSFWSVDYAGNAESAKTATFTVTADLIAPTTTTNLLPLPKIYGRADLAGSTYLYVYLSPSDPAPSSGVTGIRVTSTSATLRFYNANEAWWNGSAWQMTIHNFLTDGNYPITYAARDRSGNVESAKTTTIAVDVTRPVTTSDAGTAYTGAATVHLTPTDAFSGVATTYYKDGSGGVQQTGTTAVIAAPASGTVSHTLYYWSVDNAGNVEAQKTKSFTVTATGVDTNPPTGSISVNSGAVGINTTSATLTLSASDTGGSGLSQMRFSNDDSTWSTWETYATSKSWTLGAGDGTKTVYVQFRDVAGNPSTSYNDSIVLDTVAPVTTTSAEDGVTYEGNQTIVLSPTDIGGSGVAGTWWQLDSTSGSWTSGTSVPVVAPSTGTVNHTLYWYSRDNATNQEAEQSIGFDLSAGGQEAGAPISTILALDDSAWVDASIGSSGQWATFRIYVDDVLIGTKNAADGTSTWECPGAPVSSGGHIDIIADCGFNNAGFIWDEHRPTQFTLTLPTSSTRVDAGTWSGFPALATGDDWWDDYDDYYSYVFVPTGTISGITYETSVSDTIPPSGSVSINAGAAFTNALASTLALSASDTGGSSLYQMRFSNDGSAWSAWEPHATSKNWTLASGNGTKTVYVQYKDGAGNVSTTCSDTIALDMTAPTGSVAIDAGAPYTSSSASVLTVSASDTGGSDLYQMRFSNDNSSWSAWEAYATSKNWTLTSGTGTKTGYVQFKDTAGNVSTSFSDTIVLDATAPTGWVSINAGAIGTNTTAVMLALTASDAGGSGLAQMRFSSNGSTWTAWEAYATSSSWTLVDGDGARTVYAQFSDNVGNVSISSNDSIVLDTVVPVTACSAQGGATYSGAQMFTLTPGDSGSGVAGTWWQLDSTSGAWTSGTSVLVTAPSSSTAPHTIYFYSRDNATNQESLQSVTFSVSALAGGGTQSFSFTGADQVFTVPEGVSSLTVDLDGASGGWGGGGAGEGGLGGSVQAAIPVTPGSILTVRVGGGGSDSDAGGAGGWPNGGLGSDGNCGGAGGGSTSILLGSTVLVEAGAGGGGDHDPIDGEPGGWQGTAPGGNQPGGDSNDWGAGGGGGWNGGGAGEEHSYSGGGGSSFIAVGTGTLTPGVNAGDGSVVINW